MLYGREGELPDTNAIETITLDGASGRNSFLSDVTGDGLPEILVDCGGLDMVRIYAGRRGQRLIEQFGSGNDAPQAGKGWWRRPWAELWHAHKLDDGWTGSGYFAPFAFDGNLDGINDIWLASYPYFLCYIRLRPVPTASLEYVVTAGFEFDEDTTSGGYQKIVRPRTEGTARPGQSRSAIEVSVVPNPLTAQGSLYIRLSVPGMMRAAIYDMLGRLVRELPTFDAGSPGEYALEMDLSDLPRGMYTVRVEQGNHQASSRFTILR